MQSVRGKGKIVKKGKIKIVTVDERRSSYDRGIVIGGHDEDGDIGRVS
jgi:hypothetical protein